MEEKYKNIDYSQLAINYLNGETSDAEVQRLEKWVLSSSKNKIEFKQLKEAWILSNIESNYQNIDVEKQWEATSTDLFSPDNVIPLNSKTKRNKRLFFSIAASVALVITAAVFLYNSSYLTDYQKFASKGEIFDNQLPDGTAIYLNQYSSIEFEKKFDQKRRQIELIGDAFFEVERDTNRPFIITADEIKIEVLGTSFYVDSRKEQAQIEVIVSTGSVSVSTNLKKIILSKGETGIYEKESKRLYKKENDDINYLAWKSDTLLFDSTSLETVIHTLNRQFHAQISLANPSLKQCFITAKFIDKPLDIIIEIIELTLDIKAKEVDGKIIFSGDGCGG